MNQNTQSLLMLVKIQFPLNSFLLFSPTNLDVWLAELCPWTSQAAQWSSSAEFSHFRRLIDWHFSSFHFECDTHFGNHELSKPVWFLCHSSTISLYSWIFLVCESSGTLVTSALCATWSILHCNSVLWLCALQLVTEQSARYFPSPHSIHLSSVFHHPLANTSLIWKMTAICLTAQLRPLHFSPDSSSCFLDPGAKPCHLDSIILSQLMDLGITHCSMETLPQMGQPYQFPDWCLPGGFITDWMSMIANC